MHLVCLWNRKEYVNLSFLNHTINWKYPRLKQKTCFLIINVFIYQQRKRCVFIWMFLSRFCLSFAVSHTCQLSKWLIIFAVFFQMLWCNYNINTGTTMTCSTIVDVHNRIDAFRYNSRFIQDITKYVGNTECVITKIFS